jgi:hypothetical protein
MGRIQRAQNNTIICKIISIRVTSEPSLALPPINRGNRGNRGNRDYRDYRDRIPASPFVIPPRRSAALSVLPPTPYPTLSHMKARQITRS